MDTNLNFQSHHKKMVANVQSKLSHFRKIRYFITKKAAILIYKCTILPILALHQIRRYPAPYISKAGQKATPSNILQPFIPHCFPLQSPYINSRPFISSPHYFYSSPIRFRICPTPAQPTSILTRIVFPADQQPILNDQFYVEEMPEEIVIVVKLIYSDRTHST